MRRAKAEPRRAVVTAVRPAAASELPAPPLDPRESSEGATEVQLENLPRAKSPSDDRSSSSQPDAKPPAVEPLTADLRRYHLTVSRRFLAKLEAARDALSHVKPGATPEEILEAGLDLLLAQDMKRKGFVARPRKSPPPAKTDRVPAHIRRAVFERDGGRCQFPLASGGVCGSTYRVQLGHLTPRARGGPPTLDNLRCECEVHNQHQADLDFGKAFMARFRPRRARAG